LLPNNIFLKAMRIISWNVNGIRAVQKKGELEKVLSLYNPDILLLQEIKSQPEQLKELHEKYPEYTQFYHSAEKPGYAGTAIWVKLPQPAYQLGSNGEESEIYSSVFPVSGIQKAIPFHNEPDLFSVTTEQKDPIFHSGMPNFEDTEGRIARVDIGGITVLGIYFPNGGKSSEAWDGKILFYDQFLEYVNTLRKQGRKVIWGGDINCAHEEIDLARPKENMESIGFLPQERAWVSRVIAEGWSDIFRKKYPEKVAYSWWHVITKARERNIGWRIDSFFVDQFLFQDVTRIEYLSPQMGSDHCPILLEMEV